MPLRLLGEAHAAAGAGSSPWLRTWLLATRAEEHATRGDTGAAHRDLDDAGHILGTATAGDDGLLAHWYESPVARLEGYRGKCAELLGDSAEATTMIEGALGAFPASLVSCRCYALVDLAAAYAKEEQVEHACGLLAESLDLGSEKGLAGHIQRVIGVRQYLGRWADAAAVSDLDEQLHHLTWAPV
jgi:hypothetical protein